MIERGSHKCDERRRARILTYAPSFGRHGSKAYLDRLVKQAVEGNAWHAGAAALLARADPSAWQCRACNSLQQSAAEIFLFTTLPQFAVSIMLVFHCPPCLPAHLAHHRADSM